MTKAFSELIWDYLVFFIFITTSSFIPLWSQKSRGKQKTKADYVFATQGVSIFAMMLSIARGTLGVRSFLGFPSELFYRGSGMWETIYGMMNAYPIVCFVFIPVYFSLGITSIYQYLDLRFKSRLVRCMASGTYIVRQILNMGVTIYTPTVALNTVIGIPYYASLLGIMCIAILFNILGGLKAAIMADVIQALTMIMVSIGIIVQGTYEAGGVSKVYNINQEQGRLRFFHTDGDLTARVDTMSAWLGQLFISMSLFGCQQNFVQRYLSLKSFAQVKRTLMSNIPVIFVLFSLSWIAGCTIFATYLDCDPLKAGYTKKMDEILPFFIADKFSYMPGLLGLFMATLFNGALSIIVSNLNSLATVTWEDFFSHLPMFKGKSDSNQVAIMKTIGSLYGVLICGAGFAVSFLSGVVESSLLATSATSGPLLGVFLLAMLAPMANWKGAATGMIVSHITTLWITFGSLTINKPKHFLPTTIEGCTNETFSSGISKSYMTWAMAKTSNVTYSTPSMAPEFDSSAFPTNVYAITYMYYSLIGTFTTVIVGILVSYATASDADAYESKLLHPIVLRFSQWLPGKDRLFLDKTTILDPSDRPKCPELVQDNFGFELSNEKSRPECVMTDINSNKCNTNNLILDNCHLSQSQPDGLTERKVSELYKKLSEDEIVQ